MANNLTQNVVSDLFGVSPDAQKPLAKPNYTTSIMDRVLAQTILPDGSVYTIKNDGYVHEEKSKREKKEPDLSYSEMVDLLIKGEG